MRFPHKAERVTHHKVVAPTKFDMMSYNNNAGIPVGFRFHPTDEELVGFYLFSRITTPPPDPREEDLRIIRELDLYRHEPWDLSEVCKIPGDHSVNQNNWYFFSHKDKKYPTGNRANRATKAGFWKATGRDKCIQTRGAVGMRKTLVFYRGRAPHGQKTDWIMHEFRLDDGTTANQSCTSTTTQPSQRAAHGYVLDFHEGAGAWVVCRVFRKTKNVKTSKGDVNVDTPTTSLEEDHQMALVPELTDSTTEKFSSDEGEHVDYVPPVGDHIVQHGSHFNANIYTTMQHGQDHQQHCKQELNLSVADYANIGAEHGTMLLQATNPQGSNSMMFRTCSTTTTSTTPATGPNYNTFQLDPGSAEFEQCHVNMGGASSSSSPAAALTFSPSLANNPYLLAMLDVEHHVARGAYRSAGPAMLEGLDSDFSRFGSCNSVSTLLDQSLTDVLMTRPLEMRLQHQLQQSSELLSSTPHHDMISFGLPWQPSSSGSRSGALTPNQAQPTFVDTFSDSFNAAFLSSGE